MTALLAAVATLHLVFGDCCHGAVAQLGERLVRNEEVSGSIPLGSTSLRLLRKLRLGKPYRSEGCRAAARQGEGGRHTLGPQGEDGRLTKISKPYPAASASTLVDTAVRLVHTQLQSLASQCAKKFFSQTLSA